MAARLAYALLGFVMLGGPIWLLGVYILTKELSPWATLSVM
jgi:hypothetical protein